MLVRHYVQTPLVSFSAAIRGSPSWHLAVRRARARARRRLSRLQEGGVLTVLDRSAFARLASHHGSQPNLRARSLMGKNRQWTCGAASCASPNAPWASWCGKCGKTRDRSSSQPRDVDDGKGKGSQARSKSAEKFRASQRSLQSVATAGDVPDVLRQRAAGLAEEFASLANEFTPTATRVTQTVEVIKRLEQE